MNNFRQLMGIQNNDVIHLNNAGVGPLSLAARQVLQQFHQDIQERGYFFGHENWFMKYDQARQDIAKFFNCQVEELSYLPNCASAISQAAFAFEVPEKTKIVSFEEEYPSNAYPWVALSREKNLKLVRIPFTDYNLLQEEMLLESIDQETSIVAVSWVQFQNGATCDLEKISQRCREVGARFVVDAIQGIGVIPFDWKKVDIDILCLGTHKWICGALGLGLMISKKENIPQMKPILHGALNYGILNEKTFTDRQPLPDGRRFEPGSPNLAAVLASRESLQLISNYGVEKIHQEAQSLAEYLRQGLVEAGHHLYQPNANKNYPSSPIVTFRPRGELKSSFEKLQSHSVSCAQRLDGIRLSPHAFNTKEEIDRVINLLS